LRHTIMLATTAWRRQIRAFSEKERNSGSGRVT
jgi:hypothetical protein